MATPIKDAVRQDPLLTDPQQRLILLQSAIQAGLTDTKVSRKGTFGTATTGIFGQARPSGGIPAFGGVFGFTGREARRQVEGRIDNFNSILKQAGITPTPEMTTGIRQAFETGAGGAGAKAIVDAAILNSPEAIAARELEASRATDTFVDNQRAADDLHVEKENQAQEFDTFRGVSSERVTNDIETIGNYQGALDDVEDWRALFNAFGTQVTPGILLSDEDAAAKEAYRNIQKRMISTFQELFKAQAMSDKELELIKGQMPSVVEWSAMTDSQRRVAINGVERWISRRIDTKINSNVALFTPDAPLFMQRQPGRARDISQILALEDAPGEELTGPALAAARAEQAVLPDLRERAAEVPGTIATETEIRGGLPGVRGEVLQQVEETLTDLPGRLGTELEDIAARFRGIFGG